MADESTNINDNEILTVCVRYIDHDKRQVVERFIKTVPVQVTDAQTLCNEIFVILCTFGLQVENLSSISFDRASNMNGIHASVQALSKKLNPRIIYVHCQSHLLQLILLN